MPSPGVASNSMTDTSTVDSRFHPVRTLSAKCPSTSYTNFRPARDPKEVSTSEEEVNRRVLEILRRMTSQQGQDKLSNVVNRPLRPAKRSPQNCDSDEPMKIARIDFKELRNAKRKSVISTDNIDAYKPPTPFRTPIKPLAPRPTISVLPSSTGSPSTSNSTTASSATTASTSTSSANSSNAIPTKIFPLKPPTRSSLLDASVSSAAPAARRCSCSRSSCLKLYCDCFAAGAFCSEVCCCKNCYNSKEHEAHRQKAVMRIMHKKPDAFQSKIMQSSENTGVHTKGCNCKRSGCLKNYCECFEARIRCTSRCRCWYCYNTKPVEEGSSDQPRKLRSAHHSEKPTNSKIPAHDLGDSTSSEATHDNSVCDSSPPLITAVERRLESEVSAQPNDAAPKRSQEASSASSEEACTTPLSVSQPSTSQSIVNTSTTTPLRPVSVEPPVVSASESNVFIGPGTTDTPTVTAVIRPAAVAACTPPLLAHRPPQPQTQTVISIPTAAATSNLLATWFTLLSRATVPSNVTSIPLTAETLNLLNIPALHAAGPSPLVAGVPSVDAVSPSASVSSVPAYSSHSEPLPPQPPSHTEEQYTAEELATFDRIINQRTQSSVTEPSPNSDVALTVDSTTQNPSISSPLPTTTIKSDSEPAESSNNNLDRASTTFVVKPEETEGDPVVLPIQQTRFLTTTTVTRPKSLSFKVARLCLEVKRLSRIIRKQGCLINELRRQSMYRRSTE